MLRSIALLAALVLAAAAFAACGGSDDSSTTTATTNSSSSASASSDASASPDPNASITTGPSVTPIPETPEPTPVPGNWDVSGQFAGSATIGAQSCQNAGGLFNAQLGGTLNGTTIGILLTTGPGAIDFSQASTTVDTKVAVYYGATGAAIDAYWFAVGGESGVSGTATIESDGSGSIEVTVPPSVAAPGGATEPITISGPWLCP